MLVENRIAVVSGIGPGTGRSIALALAREGADVVLAGRNAEYGQTVAAEIEALGRRATSVPTDITDADHRAGLVESTLSTFGRIDILINNAFATGAMQPLESGPVARWRTPFNVNLFGTLEMCQAVLPAMKDAGGGAIVSLASLAARKIQPGREAYGASKAALLYAMRALAMEVGKHRIRVNCVVPSHIDGPNLQVHIDMEAERRAVPQAEVRRELCDEGVLNHISTTDEVAQAVLFFASDMASSITGQSLDVNCGQWFE